jgi:hypothetical protein
MRIFSCLVKRINYKSPQGNKQTPKTRLFKVMILVVLIGGMGARHPINKPIDMPCHMGVSEKDFQIWIRSPSPSIQTLSEGMLGARHPINKPYTRE